jgi:hypothetical protein
VKGPVTGYGGIGSSLKVLKERADGLVSVGYRGKERERDREREREREAARVSIGLGV